MGSFDEEMRRRGRDCRDPHARPPNHIDGLDLDPNDSSTYARERLKMEDNPLHDPATSSSLPTLSTPPHSPTPHTPRALAAPLTPTAATSSNRSSSPSFPPPSKVDDLAPSNAASNDQSPLGLSTDSTDELRTSDEAAEQPRGTSLLTSSAPLSAASLLFPRPTSPSASSTTTNTTSSSSSQNKRPTSSASVTFSSLPSSPSSSSSALRPPPSLTILANPNPSASSGSSLASSVVGMQHGHTDPVSEGVVDAQLVEALSGKDRLFVLRVGEELDVLVQDPSRPPLFFSPPTSFQRLIVYRCAQYLGLSTSSEGANKPIVVRAPPIAEPNGSQTNPSKRIADIVPSLPSPSAAPTFKLMVRNRSSNHPSQRGSSSRGNSTSGGSDSDSPAGSDARRKKKTYEERQQEYEEARSRIFSPLAKGAPVDGVEGGAEGGGAEGGSGEGLSSVVESLAKGKGREPSPPESRRSRSRASSSSSTDSVPVVFIAPTPIHLVAPSSAPLPLRPSAPEFDPSSHYSPGPPQSSLYSSGNPSSQARAFQPQPRSNVRTPAQRGPALQMKGAQSGATSTHPRRSDASPSSSSASSFRPPYAPSDSLLTNGSSIPSNSSLHQPYPPQPYYYPSAYPYNQSSSYSHAQPPHQQQQIAYVQSPDASQPLQAYVFIPNPPSVYDTGQQHQQAYHPPPHNQPQQQALYGYSPYPYNAQSQPFPSASPSYPQPYASHLAWNPQQRGQSSYPQSTSSSPYPSHSYPPAPRPLQPSSSYRTTTTSSSSSSISAHSVGECSRPASRGSGSSGRLSFGASGGGSASGGASALRQGGWSSGAGGGKARRSSNSIERPVSPSESTTSRSSRASHLAHIPQPKDHPLPPRPDWSVGNQQFNLTRPGEPTSGSLASSVSSSSSLSSRSTRLNLTGTDFPPLAGGMGRGEMTGRSMSGRGGDDAGREGSVWGEGPGGMPNYGHHHPQQQQAFYVPSQQTHIRSQHHPHPASQILPSHPGGPYPAYQPTSSSPVYLPNAPSLPLPSTVSIAGIEDDQDPDFSPAQRRSLPSSRSTTDPPKALFDPSSSSGGQGGTAAAMRPTPTVKPLSAEEMARVEERLEKVGLGLRESSGGGETVISSSGAGAGGEKPAAGAVLSYSSVLRKT